MIRIYKELNLDNIINLKSKEIAYILGFIAADGNLYKSKTSESLTIEIHNKDCYILTKIKKYLHIKNPIKKRNQACRLNIYGVGLIEAFARWNITVKKSFTIELPEKLPENYISHYIRGVFDGDGSVVFKYRRAGKAFNQEVKVVTASLKFANQLKSLLYRKGIGSSIYATQNKNKNRHKLYSIIVLRNSLEDFYNFIYFEDTIKLKRKKIKYKQLIAHRKTYDIKGINKFSSLRSKEIDRLLTKERLKYLRTVEKKTINYIGKKYKISNSAVNNRLKKYNIK